MKKVIKQLAIGLGVLSLTSAYAGIKFSDGDKYLKIGGRLQLQYHSDSPNKGSTTDDMFFRRLRPYIEASAHKDWKAKIQWDLGKSKTEVKDNYIEYKGFKKLKVRLGNAVVPFSSETLTSSKYQQLVERSFVGDHNYGSADRGVGLFLDTKNDSFTWGGSLTQQAVDPSNSKLDFDTPMSLNKGSDWSEGWMIASRVGYHPFGIVKMSQGDFARKTKLAFFLSAFSWSNDGDNLDPTRKDDVDSVSAFEFSTVFRKSGLSLDLQYNSFDSDLVDSGITKGLYVNSSTKLKNWSFEGGYMVVPSKFEIVLGFQNQDSDGYATAWDRNSIGLNYFVDGHNIKYQATYRQNENKDGTAGNDSNELFAQCQYVF